MTKKYPFNHRRVWYPAVVLLATLAACSRPTDVVSTWHLQQSDGGPYRTILVVGVADDGGERRRFENAMTAALAGLGIAARASNREMPAEAPLNRDSIAGVVKATGADAVLVTRLVSHEVATQEVDARTGVKVNPKGQNVYDFFRYDYDEYEESAYLVVKSTVRLSTDFYEARQGELVYTLETTTYDKESGAEIITEVTEAVAGRLKRDGLVR
jgi:hypothetical protein